MIRLDSTELAAAIRRTNARHRAAGSPRLPQLDRLWRELMADLEKATTAEEERRLIHLWESWALAAIQRGAKR